MAQEMKLTKEDFVKRIVELADDFFNRYNDEKGWPMFPWHFTISEGKYYDDHVRLSVFQAVQDSHLTTLNQMDDEDSIRWYLEIDQDDASFTNLYETYESAFALEFGEDKEEEEE